MIRSSSGASTFPAWINDGSPIADPLGHGERAVTFLRRLKHPNSTAPGRTFQLYDWQERIVRRIYGPRNPDGSRIVKTVMLLLPRGNRKTSLAAALALLHLFGPESRAAGQVLFAACDREQASIGFKEAANIIREDRRLLRAVTIRDAFNSKKQITFGKNGSTLTALASDGGAAHGLTPSFTLIDEIHAWRGRDLWEAIKSGQAKTDDTLMVIATTAGRGAEGLAADQFAYAVQVAKGEIVNPEFLPVLFMAEPEEDWQDEDVWRKVNPGLVHGFPSLSGLRALAKEAEGNPAELASFKQFNLNIWQANSRSPLFDLATYDARAFADDDADLDQLPAYIGVDMSQSGDLTAVAIAFRHADGQVTLRNTCFVPEADLAGRAHRDRAPYRQWADDGVIQLCPGGVIDQKQVEDHVRDLCARYDVQEIAVDPALARVLSQNLSDDGLPVFTHPQSAVIMSEATGNLIRTVHGEMIRHDADPLLRLHFDNVAVSTNPQSGLVRMHKQRSTGRIDAAVASAMAVSRAVTAHHKKSRYSDPDVLGLVLL
ncbi:Phage terminase-like protein, large subunit, contains N-terminal HTH domain [Gemmobacter aquatilis]|uniref:Phage terminase-like protein, large subunit, contains N-terminal HTH domain n=1 Tax=Gemmobacter aquatilis TaxID=933059 RepID=A0A1H8NRU1_9RHOB|nr:terminase TerL endonuclease subunit [Gemmobacter aquatilis]SEO32344.1 Phage terminase-like protein, large subunit, contains N-terminal HTH domain [Gemmobacter aquatilis]